VTTRPPTAKSALLVLTKGRLLELARGLEVSVPATATREDLAEVIVAHGAAALDDLLRLFGRDELKAICRAHGVDESGRSRSVLAGRLLEAAGSGHGAAPSVFTRAGSGHLPQRGDIVHARQRQYLVEDTVRPDDPGQATLVRLVCLDDDAPGRRLELLWELELGARIVQPEVHGLGDVRGLDAPRHFAAYLHALKWSSVTATDGRLFQAPFRAGIKLMNHQLTPLKKALELPRANLFIADDVGVGKTVEAGLVLQELLLRQRVELALIVAPAAICLQWRDEMERRFGLRFEVFNRAFVARRRQERGFGVNTWTTYTRFIISYQTLRRPEYRDPLRQALGERAPKSLLILDEAHTIAPASASKYAIDSQLTRVIRHDVAPRFENRLFLSATPHNGHSNSFSALLEVLDPQRFTRGVPVENPDTLSPVMVRRLKTDLRGVGDQRLPERRVIQIDLRNEASVWQARFNEDQPRTVGEGEPVELTLSRLLAEYTDLVKPSGGRKAARGKLVLINLQKRLLSSVAAFDRTLSLHAKNVADGEAPAVQLDLPEPALAEDDEYGTEDESAEAAAARDVAGSRFLQTSAARAREVLGQMQELAARNRDAPDAKALALVDWIARNLCPAVRIGGADGPAAHLRWNDRRVIVFTEYADTKAFLWALLRTAVEGTDRADERILQFHGGMSDDQRRNVQQRFNAEPDEDPVRILLATDAAREGVNLQGFCADLFHYDIPWNPARMEQRNGRIDRTLQPSPEVRCHYFIYTQRAEDVVLAKLVKKIETIQRQLGSLGAVIMDRLDDIMGQGISTGSAAQLDLADAALRDRQTVDAELETQRKNTDRLRAEIDDAGRILEASRAVMDFDPVLLRDAVDVGLELAHAEPLQPLPRAPRAAEAHPAFSFPAMPPSWRETLDTLRPPRGDDEYPDEWRKRPLLPVVFTPPDTLASGVVHLHLQHPVVQRVLSRFLAQGWSAHDLSRVTVLRNRHDGLARVIAFGRLSLFGPGATRLHDQIVSVAAQWLESKGAGHLRPFADRADARAIEMLEQILRESPTLDGIGETTRKRLAAAAPGDFAALWPRIHDDADNLAHEAERQLTGRGATEAEALRALLRSQRAAIQNVLGQRAQLPIPFEPAERDQAEQWEQDRKHMERRLERIDAELETEPRQIQALYRVVLRRLEPVGLLYLWPETRG
jgi:hypothetical protein